MSPTRSTRPQPHSRAPSQLLHRASHRVWHTVAAPGVAYNRCTRPDVAPRPVLHSTAWVRVRMHTATAAVYADVTAAPRHAKSSTGGCVPCNSRTPHLNSTGVPQVPDLVPEDDVILFDAVLDDFLPELPDQIQTHSVTLLVAS